MKRPSRKAQAIALLILGILFLAAAAVGSIDRGWVSVAVQLPLGLLCLWGARRLRQRHALPA
jgi:hypothetical protein